MADIATSAGPCASRRERVSRALLRLPLMLPKELRYLGVGATCAILNNVLLIGLVWLGVGWFAGTLITFGPVLAVGYALHTAVTFEARVSRTSFLRYAATIAAGHPVWIVVLFCLVDVIGLSVAVAAPAGTVVMFGYNFVGAHWAIVRSIRAAFRLAPRTRG